MAGFSPTFDTWAGRAITVVPSPTRSTGRGPAGGAGLLAGKR